jgi:hypothetical protein
MNKKRLLCVALTAVLTVSSTAIVAFASQTSTNTTTNVSKVAVASDKKAKTASKSATLANTTAINDTKTGAGANDAGDKAESKPVEVNTTQTTPENNVNTNANANANANVNTNNTNTNANVNANTNGNANVNTNTNANANTNVNTNINPGNISDAQAIQTAKDAIKYYTGVDIDTVISRDDLKPYISRSNSPYAWGPDIMVSFYNNSNYSDNISASISAIDGKVYSVNAMIGRYTRTSIDENKVKDAAISFLKDKGLGTNFTSITVDYEKVSVGIVGAKALYADGTEILLEFDADNNSVVNFTHYNLKTMKFMH